MPRLLVRSFSVSLDGFAAGPNQSLEHPLGVGGPELHQWMFATRMFRNRHGQDGGDTGTDNDFVLRGFENVGAWILGRNMFGPVRGHWTDNSWKGWWGDNPPYHTPVFVLTHFERAPLVMQGGTTFYFVTDGIHSALQQARQAAGQKDVRLGGGVATIRQYLQARLVDELHLAYSPVLLGAGENLLANINLPELGYRVHSHVATNNCCHVEIDREQR
jgi:dihydrofolate reductase